jgi:hypothetical protein
MRAAEQALTLGAAAEAANYFAAAADLAGGPEAEALRARADEVRGATAIGTR